MTENKSAPAGNECHYAGLSKRPARIINSSSIGATLYGMFYEEESKYGKGVNDSKYHSFLFKEKGIGIHRENGYLFLAIRLFGVQTLLMVEETCGIGSPACLAYHYLNDNECWGIVDFMKSTVSKNEMEEYFQSHLVGDVIEMSPLKEGDLDEIQKKNIRISFEKIIQRANQGYARMYNKNLVEEDEPNLQKVRDLLS